MILSYFEDRGEGGGEFELISSESLFLAMHNIGYNDSNFIKLGQRN